MKILVFGAGAIGAIYGYLLAKAGNQIVHFVRKSRLPQLKDGIDVDILDGRDEKHIARIQDHYSPELISRLSQEDEYDLILVSIKHGSIQEALRILTDSGVKGELLFFNGLWEDCTSIDQYFNRDRYCWGYPVAGGNVDYEKAELKGAILDHVLLGEIDGSRSERLHRLTQLFAQAKIKAELPENIIEWIWIHMAINVGVISTCLKAGSAASFMNSTKALKEGILSMREALEIVKARGVPLETYKKEISMYYFPAGLSALFLKRYFKTNALARAIMELHNNIPDLLELCSDVFATGIDLKVTMPLLTAKSCYFKKRNL